MQGAHNVSALSRAIDRRPSRRPRAGNPVIGYSIRILSIAERD